MNEHDKKIRNTALEEAARLIQGIDFLRYITENKFTPAEIIDEAAQAIRDVKE